MRGYLAQTPEMPEPYEPEYRAWAGELERYMFNADSLAEMLLVGHSCGGGFLLRWLSDHTDVSVRRVVLVAPWIDPYRNRCVPGFFDFKIDQALTARTDLHILYSDNDTPEVESSVQTILDTLPTIQQHFMPGRQHFTADSLGSVEFPELRDIVLGLVS